MSDWSFLPDKPSGQEEEAIEVQDWSFLPDQPVSSPIGWALAGLKQAAVGEAKLLGGMLKESGKAPELPEKFAKVGIGVESALTRLFRSAAKGAGDLLYDWGEETLLQHPEWSGKPEWQKQKLTDNLKDPDYWAYLAASGFTSAALSLLETASVGPSLGAALNIGKERQLAKEELREIASEQGLDLSDATVEALATGVGLVAGALDTIPAIRAARRIPGMDRFFAREAAKGLAEEMAKNPRLPAWISRFVAEPVKQGALEGTTEFLQEIVHRIGQRIAGADVPLVDKGVIEQGIAGAFGGALIGPFLHGKPARSSKAQPGTEPALLLTEPVQEESKLAEQLETEHQEIDPVNKELERIRGEMLAAGRSVEEAGAVRKLLENHAKVYAKHAGITPDEYLSRWHFENVDTSEQWNKARATEELFQIQKVPYKVAVSRARPEEVKVFAVSLPAEQASMIPDNPPEIELQTPEEARRHNADPERVADYQQLYAEAPRYKTRSEASTTPIGKIENIPIVHLTKGCQRSATSVERVLRGLLPRETRIESCYGGYCWVNFNRNAWSTNYENMEVRDLRLADMNAVRRWLKDPKYKAWLTSGPFTRMGQKGCDSHTIASGLAKEWLQLMREHGIKKKTIFISAGYAPVTDQQYQELAEFSDLFELHFSLSGWFHRNEILLRFGEYLAAKRAGLPASIRFITNRDGVSGINMQNEAFIIKLLQDYNVPQEDILETPFHDDSKRKRSRPTGLFKNICCETGKCITCGVKCQTGVKKAKSVTVTQTIPDAPGPSGATEYLLRAETEKAKKQASEEEFQKEGDQDRYRGRLRIYRRENDIKYVVSFFEAADPTTAPHEVFHAFLYELIELSQTSDDPLLLEDARAAMEWLGISSWDELTTDHKERFANAGVRYLTEAEPPTPELAGVFARFRAWIIGIYKTAREFLGPRISPRMKQVFDRMLATEEEIRAAKEGYELVPILSPEHIPNVDAQELDRLAALAERRAQQSIDRAVARRVKLFEQISNEARKLADDTLWWYKKLRDDGISRASLEEVMEAENVDIAAEKFPGLVRDEGGMTVHEALERLRQDLPEVSEFSLFNAMLEGPSYEQVKSQYIADLSNEIQPVQDPYASDEHLELIYRQAAILSRLIAAKQAPHKGSVKLVRPSLGPSKETPTVPLSEAYKYAEKASKAGYRAAMAEIKARVSDQVMRIVHPNLPPGRLNAELNSLRYAYRIAARHAREAYRAGRHDEAEKQMERQAVAIEALKRLYKLRDEYNKARSDIKALVSSAGELPSPYREALITLANDLGFTSRIPVKAVTLAELQAFAQAEGEAFVVPPELANLTGRLNAQQVIMVRDVMAAISHLGRAKDKALAAQQRATLTQIKLSVLAQALRFRLKNRTPEVIDKAAEILTVRTSDALERAVESLQDTVYDTSPRGVRITRKRALLAQYQSESEAVREAREQLEHYLKGGAAPEVLEPWIQQIKRRLGPLLDYVRSRRLVASDVQALLEGRELSPEVSEALYVLLSEAAMELARPLQLPSARKRARAPEFLKRTNARLLTTETILRLLDKWEMGPAYRAIYEPTQKAFENEVRLALFYTEKFQDIVRRIRETSDPDKERYIPGVGTMTGWEAIMVALNSGNEGNRNALLAGYRWTEDQLKAIHDTLSKEEWAIVEDIWGLVESMFPMISQTHQALTGQILRRVDPQPFETKNAGTVKGGYFPLIFDKELSFKAEKFSIQRAAEEMFNAVSARPQVRRGFTIERTGGLMPPRLEFSVVMQHIRDVIHYSTHVLAIRDVNKILSDSGVKGMLELALGKEKADQLRPWLEDLANPWKPMTQGDKFLRGIRERATIGILAMRFITALKQPSAITQAIDEIGLDYVAKGLYAFYSAPRTTVDWIHSESADMLNRTGNLDRDMRDLLNSIDPSEAFKKKLVDLEFLPIRIMDSAITYPVWMGAYIKAMEQNPDHFKAVAYADSVVRRTQGTGTQKDLSAFQRGSEGEKLLGMFYTFANKFYNMLAERHYQFAAGHISFARLLLSYWWLIIVPSWYAIVLEKRDKLRPKDFITYPIEYALSGIPIVRDVVGSISSGYDYVLSPAAEIPKTVVRTARAAVKLAETGAERDWWRTVEGFTELSGYALRLPAKQILTTVRGFEAIATAKTEDPMALLLGYRKEQR